MVLVPGELKIAFSVKTIVYLEENRYYYIIKIVDSCLEESLPTINALLARCEGFAEQLQYNSYVEPHKPSEGDNREWNGGILALKLIIQMPSWKCTYQIKGDSQKIERIMEHLDPKTQGTAYYTLNRFKYMQSNSLTIHGDNSDLYNNGTFDVSAVKTEGSVQIKIDVSVDSSLILDTKCLEFGLTLCDMNDIIDVDQERALKELGYDANDIENVRLSIISDTDILFAEEFYSLNYDSAFKVDPSYISSKMLESVGNFTLNLEDMGSERHIKELEKIINTLLYEDLEYHPGNFTYYNGTYIDMITYELMYLSDQTVGKIIVGSAN